MADRCHANDEDCGTITRRRPEAVAQAHSPAGVEDLSETWTSSAWWKRATPGQVTRHSDNAPLRATQAGSLLRVDHRRIGRTRLTADSACPGRAIDPHQIRADHAAFPRFRSTFWTTRVTSSTPPTPALWRSRVRFRNGSAAAENCAA